MGDERAHFIKAHNEYLTPPSTYEDDTERCVECGVECATTEEDRCEQCDWALKKDRFAEEHLGRNEGE